MRWIYCTVPFLLLGGLLISPAQETHTFFYDGKAYEQALTLYNEQQYQAAQTLFEALAENTEDGDTKANSAYYAANAAIRLNQRGADTLMEDFVKNYPTSPKRNAAFMDVGDYYFETGKYPYALKWYKKVGQDGISQKDRERFNFNMGYAYYEANRPQEAERYLKRVSHSSTYGSQADYYLGHIAYEQDDYDTANDRFENIGDPQVLEEKLSYYQADLNFKLGNFEEAIAMANKQLPKADRHEQSELHKIIGESYFNLKRYDEAIPHLKEYKGKKGKWSNTDFYLLGYSYYQQQDFEGAIGQFNKIVGGQDAVAQNAYYHLGECYLKLGRKTEALNAFRNASEMSYDSAIEKDAMLNYARLSYEIGNPYAPVPEVIQAYLEKYPKGGHQEEMKNLLVDSFITSRDFEGAMALLESNAGFASKETYQKVAFFHGMALFNDGDYSQAAEVFGKSLKTTPNPVFEARANYWKAESDYRLDRFSEAATGFQRFKDNPSSKEVEENKFVGYNLGYAHFKQKAYGKAVEAFAEAVRSEDLEAEIRADALMRLGDSHFVSRDYKAALDAYGKVGGRGRDYAAFQKAMCHGFMGGTASKISLLEEFGQAFPQSPLRDDALFELGSTYIKEGNGTLGLGAYEDLIAQFGQSKFAPQALLRQGLVHYNASRNEAALEKMKEVVNTYPGSQASKQAVSTAKLIYVDMGRVSEYAAWARGLDFVEVTDSELEEASFEAADRKYVEGKVEPAIRGFEEYLREFPNGAHALKANFTLAQLYFTQEEKDKALLRYKKVIQGPPNEYSEQALTRACGIYVEKDAYASALPYLKQLEETAEIPQNRIFAQSNLMKGYYHRKEYKNALDYAQKVLDSKGVDDRIRSDAQLMIARSALAVGDDELAAATFAEVKKTARGKTGAEAWYYDAYFKNNKGDHEGSNVSVQKLVKDFASYKEWGGKGLLLMAQNFYALGDAFQATYILENLIGNFKEYPAIVATAEEELQIIRTKEAMTNSSVDTNEN